MSSCRQSSLTGSVLLANRTDVPSSLWHRSETCALVTPGTTTSCMLNAFPLMQKSSAATGASWPAGTVIAAWSVSASRISSVLKRLYVSTTLKVTDSTRASAGHAKLATSVNSNAGNAVCKLLSLRGCMLAIASPARNVKALSAAKHAGVAATHSANRIEVLRRIIVARLRQAAPKSNSLR